MLDMQTAALGPLAARFQRKKALPGINNSPGHLLQGDEALEQLLAMESQKTYKARAINGQYVMPYSSQYKDAEEDERAHQEKIQYMGSEAAVTKMQSWARGMIARREVAKIREAKAERARREEAAIRIQCLSRGSAERKTGRLAAQRQLEVAKPKPQPNSISNLTLIGGGRTGRGSAGHPAHSPWETEPGTNEE